jgi:hypothetical protein
MLDGKTDVNIIVSFASSTRFNEVAELLVVICLGVLIGLFL